MAERTKVALIDSHALIHRAYHALPPMTTRAGLPTNAVFGFVTMLLKTFDALKPTHVVAAFDMKGKTFRSDAYAEYKAHRKAAPDDLKAQFDIVRRVVEAFNIPIVQKKGYEADDVIGTLVTKLGAGVEKIIVTGDADALQLVDPTTQVFTLKRGVTDTVLYDEALVQEKYGFPPAQLPDYKGLAGDASDNIPGVKGVGGKTASTLIGTYGSLEAVYQHLDGLKPRVQKLLTEQRDQAFMSRDLATIRRDVPIEFELEAARLEEYDASAVQQVFEELEFKSLLRRLPDIHRRLQPNQAALAAASHLAADMPATYHLVETPEQAKELRAELMKQPVIAIDTETDWLDPRRAPIVGMSVACKRGDTVHAWYIPVDRESVKEWKEVLEAPAIKKVGHNIKYDLKVFAQSDIHVAPVAFDTMVASYILQPGARQHNLDTLAFEELGAQTIPITDLIGTGKTQKKMSEVPLPLIARYAAEDADLTFRVYEKLAPRLETEGLQRVFYEFEVPLIPVLATIELNGITVDPRVLLRLEKQVEKRIGELQRQIWADAGEEFNINSTQQLRRILFEKLNLATHQVGRTKTGFSTAAAELDKLMGEHPIIARLSEYRELTKLYSTYITTLPKLIDPDTGRLYTSFNQTVAATGRLSSSDPNLQNIPVRTELGQGIRAAFVAKKGTKLVKADYSQLELRLAAHIAQDEKMIAAFRGGEDIHRATAAWVYGIAPAEVTPEQRRVAKTLNFGVLYGMGPKKFARESGLSIPEARSFIERYREQYTGVTRLFEATIEQAKTLGYVETLFGRKRYIPEIHSHAPGLRAQAERMAFNFPMQGTEADILKKAMIELQHLIAADFPEAKFILTVHDELVVEVPAAQAEVFGRQMKKIMEGVYTLDVPLEAEVALGDNWRDTVPLS